MACCEAVAGQDLNEARLRIRGILAMTAEREEQLGRAGFLSLPESTQSQLVVLQAQSLPKQDSIEAILGAEHNLRAYNAKLDDAFNLVAQIAGESGRRTSARQRRLVKLGLIGGVLALVVGVGGYIVMGELNAKEASCREAPACAELGTCGAGITLAPTIGLACKATSEEACKQSQGCEGRGLCAVVEGQCVAGSDGDCAATEGCKLDGRCSARDGQCVATLQDCRRTKGCEELGACTPVDDACVAGSDADCRQSQICSKTGACLEVNGICVLPPEDFADGGVRDGGPRPRRK